MGLSLGSNAIKQMYVGSNSVRMVYLGSTKVWPESLPVGTTYDFGYTGEVQSIELPPGTYKLQCWGAQGGDTSSYSGEGSYGGYSEGILTLTEITTLYIFVGGRGGSSGNGGWNGGGSSTGYSSYSSGDEYGESWPACGGGATDIALVTSSMSYSSGRTNRSSESILSRIIVAGGGAGASARYTEVTETVESTESELVGDIAWAYNASANRYTAVSPSNIEAGTYRIDGTITSPFYQRIYLYYKDSSGATKYVRITLGIEFTVPSDFATFSYWDARFSEGYVHEETPSTTLYKTETTSTTTVNKSDNSSSASHQGGGTSGMGACGGSQSSAGSGGAFGLGANQTSTNYRYAAGGGGGGWYGGGTGQSDNYTEYIDYTGGGSGFVNTAANASYRPSGYTGLQLDSGSTMAGNSSHPSVSGGKEVGHSGNGYARITVIN